MKADNEKLVSKILFEIQKAPSDHRAHEDMSELPAEAMLLNQTQNTDSIDGANELSLNDYKKDYQKKKEEYPDDNCLAFHYAAEPHECPVCRKFKFAERGSFAVCPVCGWEDDELMEDEPDNWAGCSNDLCLNDFRERCKSLCEKKKDCKYARGGFLK